MVDSPRFHHSWWWNWSSRFHLETWRRRRIEWNQRNSLGLPIQHAVLLPSGRRQLVGIRILQNHSPLICIIIRSVLPTFQSIDWMTKLLLFLPFNYVRIIPWRLVWRLIDGRKPRFAGRLPILDDLFSQVNKKKERKNGKSPRCIVVPDEF